jgi:hypothetical protein
VKKEIAALLVWYAKLEAGQVTAANGKKTISSLLVQSLVAFVYS